MAPFSFHAPAFVKPVVCGQLLGQIVRHHIPVSLVRVDRFNPAARRINRND